MTSTPEGTTPEQDEGPGASAGEGGGAGAEIGITEGEGSTFEPEEDPEGH
jgi:hypothetical protein